MNRKQKLTTIWTAIIFGCLIACTPAVAQTAVTSYDIQEGVPIVLPDRIFGRSSIVITPNTSEQYGSFSSVGPTDTDDNPFFSYSILVPRKKVVLTDTNSPQFYRLWEGRQTEFTPNVTGVLRERRYTEP